MKTLQGSKLQNTTVIYRPEFSVPVSDTGEVLDDFRIRSSLPTLEWLVKAGCKIVVISKIGRPDGKYVKKYSMRSTAKKLAELLSLPFFDKIPKVQSGRCVVFIDNDPRKETLGKKIKLLHNSAIIVIENIRFYPEEEAGDSAFARKLSKLGTAYVSDCFGVAHRADASVSVLPSFLPHYAGLLMESEVRHLNAVTRKSVHPFIFMLGGAKLSEKLGMVENVKHKVDMFLIGGGIANLFFKAQGYEIGTSMYEQEGIQIAKNLLASIKHKIMLPKDVVVSSETGTRVCAIYQVRSDETIFDIGPKSILEFSKVIKTAKTLVWNGPLGHFEQKPFDTGTIALAKVVGGRGKRQCFTVIGGGETVEAIRKAGQEQHIDHLSTGGGAMLEYLAGKELPGITALT